jgi:hypothetical protein
MASKRKSPAEACSRRPTGGAGKPRAWCPYMYLLPSPAAGSEWTSGVLRRQYNGRTNDLVEFVRAKLHPVDLPSRGTPWKPTAARHEVLLPPGGVSDLLLDPRRLTERYADQLLTWQTSLLAVIKIVPAPQAGSTMNEAWQVVHGWAVSRICRARGLPVILVQHAPFLAGKDDTPAHLHALIFGRRMSGGSSFGGIDFELTSDEGHPPLYAEYKAYAAHF